MAIFHVVPHIIRPIEDPKEYRKTVQQLWDLYDVLPQEIIARIFELTLQFALQGDDPEEDSSAGEEAPFHEEVPVVRSLLLFKLSVLIALIDLAAGL